MPGVVAPRSRRAEYHRTQLHRAYTFPYGAANDRNPSHHRAGPLCLDGGLCWFGRYANPWLLHHPLRTRPQRRHRRSSAPPDGRCRHRCPSENGASVKALNAPRHIPNSSASRANEPTRSRPSVVWTIMGRSHGVEPEPRRSEQVIPETNHLPSSVTGKRLRGLVVRNRPSPLGEGF
jgi:hypothetical protein